MITRCNNIIHQKFGRLFVLEKTTNSKHGFARWKCKCDCGQETIVYGVHLIHKKTTSCGCYNKEQTRNKLSKNPFLGTYNRLLNAAKRTNRECSITYEDYLAYTKIPTCTYCNHPLKWIPYKRRKDPDAYAGYNLDRKDNAVGYTNENCVACCSVCNHIKGKVLSYSEMLKLGPIIGEIRKTRDLFSPGQHHPL